MRKLGLLLVMASLLLVVATTAGARGSGESSTSGTTAGAAVASGWKYTKYDPPVSLTMNQPLSDLLIKQIPDGYSVDNNAYTRWLKDKIGVVATAKWISSSSDVNSQKLNLAIASNDLPDFIRSSGRDLAKLAKAGLVTPLNDLMKKYDSPLTQYILDEFQSQTQGGFFASASFNKKIYGIPSMLDVWASTWSNNWIRSDIVAGLGLALPQTLADFENILAAYSRKYPDGVGHILSVDGGNITGMNTAMEPFDAHPGHWIAMSDGTLAWGSVQPEVKNGLAELRKWYANGWLDKEFVVKDSNKASEALVAGNALSLTGMWWYVWSPFPDMLKNVAGSDITAYPPLKGPNGKSVTVVNSAFGPDSEFTSVSAKFKNPEALLYILNESMDSQFRSDQALRDLMKSRYLYDFIYPYTEYQTPLNPGDLPGQYKYNYPVNAQGFRYFNEFSGYPFGVQLNQRATELVGQYLRIIDAENKGTFDKLPQIDKDEKGKYLTTSAKRWTALVSSVNLWNSLNKAGGLKYDAFGGAPTPTMISKNALLQKMELETFTGIIMGTKPLEAFDQFVKDWAAAGGSDITKEVTAWYQDSK